MGTVELKNNFCKYRATSLWLPLLLILFLLAGGECFAQRNQPLQPYQRQNPNRPAQAIPSALLPPQNQILPNNSTPKNPYASSKKTPKTGNPQYTEKWGFSIEPHAGLRYGIINEIIWYPAKYTKEAKKLSLLEWEFKQPSWYVGIAADLKYKRFEIGFDSKFFIPAESGIIKDHDWMQGLYKGYVSPASFDVKTNYSESANFLTQGQDLDLVFSFKFFPTENITLRPRLGANYYHMAFNAKGGWYSYGNERWPYNGQWTDSNGKTYHYNYYAYNDQANNKLSDLPNYTVLEYDAHTLFLWLGLQADFFPLKKLGIMLASEVTPFMYSYTVDNHPLRNTIFLHQSYSIFFGFRQKLHISFAVTKHVTIDARGQFVFTGETTGNSYVIQGGKTLRSASNSGTQVIYFDAGLGVRLSW